jgi:FkbM family methyltransferase
MQGTARDALQPGKRLNESTTHSYRFRISANLSPMDTRHWISQSKNTLKVLLGKSVRVQGMVDVDHVLLGSRYNEWPLLPELMSSKSVVYSFGVGENISFDLATIERFHPQLYAFDPTPKSIEWIHQQTLPPEFHFEELGVAKQTGELIFQPPSNANHVSYSVAKNGNGAAVDAHQAEAVHIQVFDLRSIMERMHHDHINVLKLDVEGCEYGVIDSLLELGVLPEQLMVEFHHGLYGYTTEDTKRALATLRQDGYLPYYVSDTGREIGFVRGECLATSSQTVH